MRLNSRTGIEGPPVSSLNWGRSLHSGLKAPELVMYAGCRDNRWTASLCTWPPGCSPVVLPPSQEVGSAWARSAWLVVNTQVKACSRETHSPSRAFKTDGHNAFQIIHILNTAHIVGSDCDYNPGWCRSHITSPKWPNCVEWDVKPCSMQSKVRHSPLASENLTKNQP